MGCSYVLCHDVVTVFFIKMTAHKKSSKYTILTQLENGRLAIYYQA